MVYIMNDGCPLGLPSKLYINVILAGYETAEFDKNAIKNASKLSSLISSIFFLELLPLPTNCHDKNFTLKCFIIDIF